jgi:hypothetical protein
MATKNQLKSCVGVLYNIITKDFFGFEFQGISSDSFMFHKKNSKSGEFRKKNFVLNFRKIY